MLATIKKHILVVLLAIVVSIFTFAPQMMAINSMGDKFSGVYPINTVDDMYYMARAKDIVDGHSFLSNPYLYEYKDGSPMQFWLPDYLLTKPLELFGVSVSEGYIFYDMLLPIILTILTYSIFYSLTRSRAIAFSFASILHLGIFLSAFARNPSPQFNFIFWLILALFLIKLIQSREKKYAVLATLAFGLQFHFYTYYWTFYVVLIVVFVVLAWLFGKRQGLKYYLGILLGALVIGMPYFISLYQSTKLLYYQESIYRLGMIDTHFPSGIKIVALAAVLLVVTYILYLKKIVKINQLSILLVSGVVASVICVNQHIITGKNLEFSSHYWMPSVFWAIFLVAYLLKKSLIKIKYNWTKLTPVFIILVLIFSFFGAKPGILSDAQAKDYEIGWQEYSVVFDWLKNNTEAESVVYANSELSNLIPVYTDNNIYYNRFANLFFIPDEEVYERFVINNFWEKFDDEFIYEHQRFIWGVHYIDEYGHHLSKNKIRKLLFLPAEDKERIPIEKIAEFKAIVAKMQAGSIADYILKYRVDYLIWDKKNNPNWELNDLDLLNIVYQQGDFVIYQLN